MINKSQSTSKVFTNTSIADMTDDMLENTVKSWKQSKTMNGISIILNVARQRNGKIYVANGNIVGSHWSTIYPIPPHISACAYNRIF